jgi:SNF2 family DNA or RNA helicase
MNHSPVLPFDPPASEGKEVTPQVDTTEGGAEEGEDPPHKPTDAAAGKMAQPVFKGGGQLRDYQWEAVLWLVHNWKLKKGSILADEVQRPFTILPI